MNKELFKFFDVIYFIKLLSLFLLFYYFNLFFIGITAPGNYYSSFLDHHLNYVAGFRNSVLHMSNLIATLLGLDSHVDDLFTITANEYSVTIVYSCLGFGVMSFWTAFVLAGYADRKKKIMWILSGLIIIWLLNCTRMAILLLAMTKHWPVNSVIDHHTLFNIISYALIIVMTFLYYKDEKNQKRSMYLRHGSDTN